MMGFCYLHAEARGLSPAIICFSWHNPGSGRCRDVVDVLSGNSDPCLEGNLRPVFLGPVYSLPKPGSPSFQSPVGLGVGVGGSDNFLFGLAPSVTKKAFFLTCWRIWGCTKGWGGDFIKLANINTSLLKTGGSRRSQSGWVYTFFFFFLPLELLWAQAIQGKEFEGYFVSGVGSL